MKGSVGAVTPWKQNKCRIRSREERAVGWQASERASKACLQPSWAEFLFSFSLSSFSFSRILTIITVDNLTIPSSTQRLVSICQKPASMARTGAWLERSELQYLKITST